MAVHQVVVAAAPGDAVTNSALEFRMLLRGLGPSELFAHYIDPALEGDVHQLRAFDAIAGARSDRDLLLAHGSIGDPAFFDFVRTRSERLGLVYHNISPADRYDEYDAAFANLLRSGRDDIASLAGRVVLALAPSRFNADELVALGYHDVRVSPLIVDAASLRELQPDAATTAELDAIDGPVLLSVGQLLPHKAQERLVMAFHVFTTYARPDAQLLLVGASRSPAYRSRLQRYVDELGLTNVRFVGSVSDAVLAAHFRRADVYVSASEHEGFCVPLLEAMAFGVPVVARACGAVPETMEDAGICLPGDAGALVFAAAVERLIDDAALRERLIARGTQRLAAFDVDDARTTFLAHVRSVA